MIRRLSSFVFLLALVVPLFGSVLPSAAQAACIPECSPGFHCEDGVTGDVCAPGPGPTDAPTQSPGPTCGSTTCVTPQICCVASGFPDPFCAAQATCDSMQIKPTQSNTTTASPSGGAVTNNASGGSNSGVALINPLKVDTVPEFLALILAAVVNLGTIILVLMLVYVGFLFVVAQGNEEKLQNAKSALLWTVVGGLVLLGAQAISLVIQATVGSLQ
ncbi:MAG: hypothetical protein KBD05_03145 [Candidatus Pacebacteria bacterium]|nr:hypothetical protein [Candidatus Paceibacterota bacterium]